MRVIQGIDAGGDTTKYCDQYGYGKFSSLIGEYRDLRIGSLGPDDMKVTYEGVSYYSGPIVTDECEHGGSRKGDTKAHLDAKLRILIACHKTTRFKGEERFIVVGQPIKKFVDDEKTKIRNMLTGKHEITINDHTLVIDIKEVMVAPEGAVAGLADPMAGLIRYLDAGSGTTNFGTTNNMKFNDRDSTSERSGIETAVNNEPENIARRICNRAFDKWEETDFVRVLGGDAQRLEPYIRQYFPNGDILRPKYKKMDGSIQVLDPVFGNVVAFYELAKKIFS